MNKDGQGWNTADEIRYIRGIGKYGEKSLSVKMAPRTKLLKDYLNQINHRRWDVEVDVDTITKIAMGELLKAQEQEARHH